MGIADFIRRFLQRFKQKKGDYNSDGRKMEHVKDMDKWKDKQPLLQADYVSYRWKVLVHMNRTRGNQTRDRPPRDQSRDRPRDRSRDQPRSRGTTGVRSSDRPGKSQRDSPSDRSRDRPNDRSRDRSSHRSSDRSSDHPRTIPSERPGNRSSERPRQSESSKQSRDRPRDCRRDYPRASLRGRIRNPDNHDPSACPKCRAHMDSISKYYTPYGLNQSAQGYDRMEDEDTDTEFTKTITMRMRAKQNSEQQFETDYKWGNDECPLEDLDLFATLTENGIGHVCESELNKPSALVPGSAVSGKDNSPHGLMVTSATVHEGHTKEHIQSADKRQEDVKENTGNPEDCSSEPTRISRQPSREDRSSKHPRGQEGVFPRSSLRGRVRNPDNHDPSACPKCRAHMDSISSYYNPYGLNQSAQGYGRMEEEEDTDNESTQTIAMRMRAMQKRQEKMSKAGHEDSHEELPDSLDLRLQSEIITQSDDKLGSAASEPESQTVTVGSAIVHGEAKGIQATVQDELEGEDSRTEEQRSKSGSPARTSPFRHRPQSPGSRLEVNENEINDVSYARKQRRKKKMPSLKRMKKSWRGKMTPWRKRKPADAHTKLDAAAAAASAEEGVNQQTTDESPKKKMTRKKKAVKRLRRAMSHILLGLASSSMMMSPSHTHDIIYSDPVLMRYNYRYTPSNRVVGGRAYPAAMGHLNRL